MSRPVLRTPLCETLGIEYPIILAGMGAGNEGGAAGPELVAAVSEAGGLGVLGGTGHDVESFHAACAKIRSLTKKPFGVDMLLPYLGKPSASPNGSGESAGPPPIDSKYWEWVDETIREFGLEQPPAQLPGRGPFTETPYVTRQRQQERIEAIVKEKPAVFAAGLGSPGPYMPQLRGAGFTVFGLVGNVKSARRVNTNKKNNNKTQNNNTNNHTGRGGTFALTPQVVDAVAPTPVVLAGGVADGRGVAAALALGAQAVWVGTAFLATPEANILPEHREHLLASSEEDTRITRLYSGKTARCLVSPVIESWERSQLPALPMGQQGQVSGKLEAAVRVSGRNDLRMHLGGQVAGAIKEIRPAHVVLDEMVREAVDVLTTLTRSRVTFAMA